MNNNDGKQQATSKDVLVNLENVGAVLEGSLGRTVRPGGMEQIVVCVWVYIAREACSCRSSSASSSSTVTAFAGPEDMRNGTWPQERKETYSALPLPSIPDSQ